MIGLNYLGKMGQLGNQMFQYAAIRGIARKAGLQFTIPDHTEVWKDSLGNNLRIELFDVFDINPDITGFLAGASNIYTEKHFHFDEKMFDCKDNVCLAGYFQTEKYFKHIEDDIRKEYTFKSYLREAWDPFRESCEVSIGLHIRRGDFLKNSGNHHNLSMSYYEKALQEFPEDTPVIIFSDDTDWCKEQELFSSDRFLVSESGSSYVDLCLMSMCSYHIIANSSFSWWGAWLADSKKVVYPDKWFGPNNADKSTEDLFPEEWSMVND